MHEARHISIRLRNEVIGCVGLEKIVGGFTV